MADYGIFRANDAKKVAQATRIVLGGPRTYVHVPQRIPNKGGSSTTAETTTPDDGFPPGTGDCNCANCLAGITIPDALECCTSHLRWSLQNPWLACATTDLVLEYAGNDTWLTDPFEGPDCDGNQNEYRWLLEIDIDGRSYLTLVLETDNGCDPVCLIYGRESFVCQCNNVFTRDKPYGTVIGVPFSDVACEVCVKPKGQLTDEPITSCGCFPTEVELPLNWTVDFGAGYTNGTGTCHLDNCAALFEQSLSLVTVDDPATLFGQPFATTTYGPAAVGIMGLLESTTCDEPIATTFGDYLNGRPLYAALQCRPNLQNGTLGITLSLYAFPVNDCANCVGGALTWEYYSASCEQDFYAPDFSQPLTLTLADTGAHSFDDIELCATMPTTITLTAVGGTPSPTSDGVCDETCETTPDAPANPDGYCCFEGSCYDQWDAALCAALGGTFTATGTCGESTCEDVGPCCVAGTCLETDGYTCVSILGGTLAGGDCDDGVCDEGACCDATDGTCGLALEADCQAPNYFWGAGTDCDPDPCADLGYCCTNDQTPNSGDCGGGGPFCGCIMLPEGQCSGNYGGDGSNCSSCSSCSCVAAFCEC